MDYTKLYKEQKITLHFIIVLTRDYIENHTRQEIIIQSMIRLNNPEITKWISDYLTTNTLECTKELHKRTLKYISTLEHVSAPNYTSFKTVWALLHVI